MSSTALAHVVLACASVTSPKLGFDDLPCLLKEELREKHNEDTRKRGGAGYGKEFNRDMDARIILMHKRDGVQLNHITFPERSVKANAVRDRWQKHMLKLKHVHDVEKCMHMQRSTQGEPAPSAYWQMSDGRP